MVDHTTDFHPEDAPPPKRDKFERLRRHNTGEYRNPTEQHKRFSTHAFYSIAGQIDAPARTIDHGAELFEQLDSRIRETYSVPSLAFACIVYVLNQHSTEAVFIPNTPIGKYTWVEQAREQLEIDSAFLESVYKKVIAECGDP